MMRGFIAALLLVPAAAAQSVESGCIESDPCGWLVEVDDDGFDPSLIEVNGTSGDWYIIDVFNFGDATHTVSLAGHGVSVTVNSIDDAQSEPFQLGDPGDYQMMDDPSGTSIIATVLAAEASEQAATQTDEKATPSIGPIGLLAALGLLLARRR